MSRKARPQGKRRAQGRKGTRINRKTLRNGAVAALAIGVIAAVIALGFTQQGGGGSGSGNAAATASVPGMEVPDFTVKTTSWNGGRAFTLSRNLDKPTALFFVASWCFTCIPETQAWGRVHQEMGNQVNILILDVDTRDTEAAFLRFKERADGGDHLWAMDVENRVALAYKVRSLDTTIIIDQKGREVYRDTAPTPYEKIKEVLTKVLAGEAVAKEEPGALPGQFYPDQGRVHLQPGQTFDGYNSNPPTSGPHAPRPAPWGVYDQPLSREVLVHNLEHSGVLILYRCTNCPEVARQLREFGEGYLRQGRKIIVAPYPDMNAGFALAAWGYLDSFNVLDPARLSQFMASDVWRKAPEADVN